MTLRKKQLIVGYMTTLAVLCLVYALMPLFPAVAWSFNEAQTNVQTEALERAISRYRVKQIVLAQRESSRVPDSTLKESELMPIHQDIGAGAAKPFESHAVDQQVTDLLKTVSLRESPDGGRQPSKVASVVANPNVVSTVKPPTAVTSKATTKKPSTPTGIKIALASSPAESVGSKKSQSKSSEEKPRGNSIRIPSIKVDMPVLEGNEKVLERGAWLMPESALPGQGNTVISAHRYQSFGSKSFYHLDKVKTGDVISVWWNAKEYRYRVVNNTVVKPDQVDVLNKSSHGKLTLVTCDPVFSTKNRRIVVAELVE